MINSSVGAHQNALIKVNSAMEIETVPMERTKNKIVVSYIVHVHICASYNIS